MSVSVVKPYARARLRALGYTEWKEGFNFENIPKTKLDSSFHLELGDARAVSHSQDNLEIEVPITVRIFRAPGKNSSDIVDRAITKGDEVRAGMLAAADRLTQSGIKNVLFETMAIEPLANSNDNGVIVTQGFTVVIVESLR